MNTNTPPSDHLKAPSPTSSSMSTWAMGHGRSQSADHDAVTRQLSFRHRLPPLIPSRHSAGSSFSKPSDMDLITEGGNVDGSPAPKFHFPVNESRRDIDCLPPPIEHRRSISDSPLGFSNFIQSSPQYFPIGSPTTGKNTFKLVTRDAVSGAPHRRSSSLDVSRARYGNLSMSDLESLSVTFTEEEKKRIISCDKLAAIVMSDPKRTKRIVSNRVATARAKQRRLEYTASLELEVKNLEEMIAALSIEVNKTEKHYTDMLNENSEMKFHLEALELETRLKDALNETLAAEAERLKCAVANVDDDTALYPSCVTPQISIKLEMHQWQQEKLDQDKPSETTQED